MHQLCVSFRTLVLLIGCFGASNVVAVNQLAGHPSPYLAMHAEDPVSWRPWQATVFDDARTDNRLVFVSIGYFSCHWCHVMQRQSYQDPGVAKLLNQRYISVKVDRELDPDLDRRLIDFVEAVRGSAGWPLNVFLTPDGYPVTGFTYLPRDNFAAVLEQLDDQWRQDRDGLAEAARDFFTTQMQGHESQPLLMPNLTPDMLADAFLSQAMQAADELQGGFGNTSKFPNVPQLDSLLDLIQHNPDFDPDVVDFVKLTLQMMASGNLQDHVNGGFFRYTTDPDWQTPHFEKMLYDNAQLAALYLRADRQWPDLGFADIALRTLDFVEENLMHSAGGYLSSLSAVDDNDREGGAYFWNREQLAEVLTKEELEYLTRLWKLDAQSGEFLIKPLPASDSETETATNKAILRKLQKRGSSSMPADEKRLASWNAMMLNALTSAADIDPRFAHRAQRLFDRLKTEFYRGGTLIRFAGNAGVADAVFEDYAQLARAFFNFGRKFEHDDAINLSRSLTETAHSLFLKQDRWQQKAQPLIPIAPGKWVIPDLVFISPMTLWLEVALKVPGLSPEVRESAASMLGRATPEMLNSPYFYGSFIMLRVDHAG